MTFLGLPDDTNTASASYEAAVLNASSRWETPWWTLPVGGGSVQVLADALKIDGVRINATAELTAHIAEVLGAHMLTPELSDLMWSKATTRLAPVPRPISSTVSAMIANSQAVDAQAPRGLSCDPGKDWVTTDKGIANYGWHLPSAEWGRAHGLPVNDAVTDGMYVVQPVFYGHKMRHSDYSQVVRLWRPGTISVGKVAGAMLAAVGVAAAVAIVVRR